MNVNETVVPSQARKLTIAEFLESCDLRAIPFVWTDWWCKYDALPARAKVLVQRLRTIAKPCLRFDPDQTRVTFSNVVPIDGVMYDEIHITDLDDRLTYTIIPRSGRADSFERAQVYEHATNTTVVDGTWADVKTYFRSAP